MKNVFLLASPAPQWLNLFAPRSLRLALFTLCLSLTATLGYADSLAPPLSEQALLAPKHPEAEILYSITETRLQADGHWQQRHYYSIRINDITAARDYGRIAIGYNHYYSNLELEFANTLSREGKLNALAKDALQTRITGGGQDFYSDSSELVFSLPEIAPGSIIEFQFTRKSLKLPLPALYFDRTTPYWYQPTVGGDGLRADYVHNYSYTIEHPKSQKLFTKSYSGHPRKGTVTQHQGLQQQRWQMHDIAAQPMTNYLPRWRDFIPTLHLSTATDWGLINKWSWQLSKDKFQSTPAIKEAVANLHLAPTASNEEKVRAVYRYVQNNIRYVFAHLGRGGYEPHFADQTLKAAYGDCKDQTILTVAMLRELGINAFPAVLETARAGDHDAALVELIFDHMLVHIPAGQNVSTLWLDTTGDKTLYPGMSYYNNQQNILIIDNTTSHIQKLHGFEHNKAQLNMHIVEREDKGLDIDVDIALSGYFEQYYRSWWIHSQDKENALQQLFDGLFNKTANATFSGALENSEDIFTPVKLTAKFTLPNENTDTNEPVYMGASLNQALNMFTSYSRLPLPNTRTQDFNDELPLEVELQATFTGLDDHLPALIRSADDISDEFFTTVSRTHSQDNQFFLTINHKKRGFELTKEQYQRYYQDTQKLLQQPNWLLNMQPNQPMQANSELQNIKQNAGEKSVEFLLALAKKHIDDGDFIAALEPAQNAVKLDSENGEAWYLLAMAQGFNTQLEASEKSFAKAESLGYLP